ncbi:hypothetical protein F2P56_033977 [Juglans regia]|uniref:Uncharacterized protein LOC108990391 n=2 Tax=Juglans regia TaxID=51240 RepID=A0A6P9EFZ5_JUGRE|nr:uncharacterized protein LOC108990391 [Juglans regia]KAF5444885.1 hypothetical protein F2P56_033977 [Juglans regia]
MAADLAVKLEAENPCCKGWREKYSNLEKKRYALRQAVNILTPQIDTFQSENAILKKAFEEEQARADNEKEGRLKESIARVSLENEISVLKSEISQVKQKASLNAVDRDKKVRLLQDCISEREKEINRLKELLEKEKKRADTERKNAEGEKKKAAEMFKSLKAEKDEERRIARTGAEKAEQYRLQLEILKKEADEAKSKLASETMKFERANKRLGEERKKALKERKRADLEMAKAEERRKLAEANGKKAVEEKCHADNLYRQLEENRQRVFQNLAFLGGQTDNKLNPESVKTKNRLQCEILNREVDEHKSVLELLKESNKMFEVENQKAIKEKKLADSEMAKAEEQKNLADVNWKKAMLEKCRADRLSQQLQENKKNELQPSRKLVERSSVAPVKTIASENANVKLLKKELKLEKKQAKHAKRVAKLEKSHNHILQQELGHLKLEFDQFANRLDILNESLAPRAEGIDDPEKNVSIAYMQRLNMMKNLCSLEPTRAHLQSENELVRPSCMDMDVSYPLRQSLQHPAQLLPISGGNFDEPISGINSKLESPLGCSNSKMLQTSAINSSMASFSDGQLMGSQEKGALSGTTSTKLVEENLNAQPTISNLSGEVTKLRCCEKSAVVGENNVKIADSDDVGRGCDCSRKRKWLLDSAEPIEYLYSKGKKLCVQIEENLSLLHGMLDRRIGSPLEEVRCLAPNPQCIPHGTLDGFHKKSKVSPEEVHKKHFCVGDEQKKTEKSGTEVLEDSSDLETMASFEDVADGEYMKLLDLDDAADEQHYRMAAKRPVSPSLPIIDFDNRQIFDVDCSEALVVEWTYKEVSTEHSFDVIDVEIESNKLKHTALGTSCNLSLHKIVAPADSVAVIGNGFSTVEAGNARPQQVQNSGLVVGISNLPRSREEEVDFPFESEFGSACDTVPKYCVVSPNMRDRNVISKIFKTTKTCIARCCLLSQTEWVVPKILLALMMEENILLVEKVCVFFTLVLLNLSSAAPRKVGNCLDTDSILWLDSFSGHIRAVMSDVETRSMLADFDFLDELLSLIEEFLIDGRVLVYTNISCETFIECDTRINFLLDGVTISFSYEVPSADQLVAGSIILASMCAAIDQIGFICEASYNIFRRHACDSSLVLSILHVFAYLCGQKLFSATKYGLMVTVFKSIVMLLEGVNFSDPAASHSLSVSEDQFLFHPCTKCPFSKDAVSIDTVTSLLLKFIWNNAGLETTNYDVIKSLDLLNSEVLYNSFKSEVSSSHEGFYCAADVNFDTSCCLEKYEMPTTQSHSIASMRLCHLTDVLSLVELVACNMRWNWTCIKMIPQLLKILELCVLEDFAAAIVVLLGQLGRLGVDAGGYEDKGVENLRCNLYTFLNRYTTMKAGLHLQIATATALLGLLPDDFDALIQSNVKIQVTATQSLLADSMRKWFSLLSKEQQDLSVRLLQPAGAKQK